LLESCVEEGVLFTLDRAIATEKGESYHDEILCSSLRAPGDVNCVGRRCCGHNVPFDAASNKIMKSVSASVMWLEILDKKNKVGVFPAAR
jgi:hypothetical protein